MSRSFMLALDQISMTSNSVKQNANIRVLNGN